MSRPMFEDFCEECIDRLPADQLSGFGIRCKVCDPGGIEREGTYYDACSDIDDTQSLETVDSKPQPVL